MTLIPIYRYYMSKKTAHDAWVVKSSDEGKGAINNMGLCEEKHFVDALARRNPDLEYGIPEP